MGQWMARFLLSEKLDVVLVGRDENKLAAACSKLHVEGTTDLAATSQADLIIISVPIAAFEQTVKELSRFVKKGQTVVDVTSVKVMPMEVMHQHLAGCLILGT